MSSVRVTKYTYAPTVPVAPLSMVTHSPVRPPVNRIQYQEIRQAPDRQRNHNSIYPDWVEITRASK
jgi:hypothetical protein